MKTNSFFNPTECLKNQSGFSLVNIMVGLFLMSLISVGMAGLLSSMNKEMKFVDGRAGKNSLAQDLRTMLLTSSICTNSFVGQSFNTAGDSPLRAQISPGPPAVVVQDNTTIQSYKIYVKRFFANGPVYVSTNGTFSTYLADLKIESSVPMGGTEERSLSVAAVGKIYFKVAAAAPHAIESCYIVDKAVLECPTGYTLMGDAGTPAAFCIQTAANAGRNYFQAKSYCQTQISDLGMAYLCTHNRWYEACNAGIPGLGGTAEWVGDFSPYMYGGQSFTSSAGAGCTGGDRTDVNSALPFRCCYSQ